MLLKTLKIFGIVGFAVALFFIGYQLGQKNTESSTKKIPKILTDTEIYLGIGNKYFESKIGDKYFDNKQNQKALEQYRLALAREPQNTEVIKRIVEVFIKNNSCEENRLPIQEHKCIVKSNQLDEALTLVYKAQSINPALETDFEWIWYEFFILKTQSNTSKNLLATKVLDKILPVNKKNIQVLSELGFLKSKLFPQEKTGIELLQQAKEIDPNNIKICYYLSEAYKSYGNLASQIRESYRCTKLAENNKSLDSGDYTDIVKNLYEGIFWNRKNFKTKGILSEKFNIPITKRIEILEYLRDLPEPSQNSPFFGYEKASIRSSLLALYLVQEKEALASEITNELVTLVPYRSNPNRDLVSKLSRDQFPELTYLAKQKPNSKTLEKLKLFFDGIGAPLNARIANFEKDGKDLGPVIFGTITSCGLATSAGLEDGDLIRKINGIKTPSVEKVLEILNDSALTYPVIFEISKYQDGNFKNLFELRAESYQFTPKNQTAWLGIELDKCSDGEFGGWPKKFIDVKAIINKSPLALAKEEIKVSTPFSVGIEKINGKEKAHSRKYFFKCLYPTLKEGDKLQLALWKKGNDSHRPVIISLKKRPHDKVLSACDL